MLSDKLSASFPAGDTTDGQYLYRSLGSFWTNIFQDKDALRGYTTAMAEEAIQAYYNLIEVVNQYSVKDIDLYHKEKWLPITIKKSEFNKAPFVFEPGGALFGYQPASDLFYAGQLFRFGFPRETLGGKVFSFTPSLTLAKAPLIANRVIAPSQVFVPGVDVILKDGTLYFKTDLFASDYIPKAKLVGEFGAPITYKTADGQVLEEEFIILWAYMANIDNQALANNFGTILNVNLPTSQSYKELLKALVNLYVEGPTITAIKTIFAALINSPVIVEPREIVEELYSDLAYQYLITDKNVYKIPVNLPIQDNIAVGDVLYAGDVLTDNLKIIDTVIDPLWWKTEIYITKLGFASHIFAASTKNQLFFSNGIELVSYTGGNPSPNNRLTFPVTGRPEDVQAFQDYINDAARKSIILAKLGFSENKTSSTAINPVDFLFNNLFKNNTLLLRLDFYSQAQLELFFALLPTIQQHLPPHVYLLTYLQFQMSDEVLTNLNTGLSIEGYTNVFSLDGSDSVTGARPGDLSDPEYYKDYINRMFCIAVGPYKDNQPLHADGTKKYNYVDNLDRLTIDNSISRGNSPGIKCGLTRTEIPQMVKPPGELYWRIPSTREIPTILLIDF